MRHVRICLISPPTVTDFEDASVAESDAIRLIAEHAPIGVLSLAAVVEGLGHPLDVIDLNRWYYEYLRASGHHTEGRNFCEFAARRLAELPVDVYGFSTICSSYPLTLRMAQEVKRVNPRATVILGGPQASVVDVATLREFSCVDYIVRGEAEVTLPLLLGALTADGSLAGIEGITYRADNKIVRTPNAPVISDLDTLPMPAFHLYPYVRECRYLPLELGRGCPFACEFCSTNDFFRRRFRLKSPDRVIGEMSRLQQQYGVSTFDLVHDMFTVDRKRVVEFCEALLASGKTFYWNCSARTDCVDDELIELMAQAGCKGIFFGIETGSPRLQKSIKKRLDLADAARRIECTDRHGITTAVSLITGFPEETMEDLRDTVHFLLDSLRLDNAAPQLHLLAPLAETPIHARYRDQLTLDDIYSDMSYQGWRQDRADRRMIEAHPDVFPNFYNVPTPWLERAYLQELRDFILHGMQRFRWLLVALHQQSGDLLTVFDAWRAWRHSQGAARRAHGMDSSVYYANLSFRLDFLRFLRSDYLSTDDPAQLAVTAMVEFETAFDPPDAAATEPEGAADTAGVASEAPGPVVLRPDEVLGFEAVPRLPDRVRVAHLGIDYNCLISCLKEKGNLAQVPRLPLVMAERRVDDHTSEFVQLSHLSTQLLQLCDGTRTVRQIADLFGTLDVDVDGIAPVKAGVFGLELLRQQGVIEATQPVPQPAA
ncbi:hypothetical protein AR457_41105 [Streptomyces agglomeratus]|uniref:B12-binding domain-containing radical SAM protein n=1 Tax=Streptomyces agglomeratus TaxID=285458 RepID=UPI000869FF3F|nr:radical SAM protein [Streptomyces agglomeratus]OEJ21824.1 hypothetical protein AR457_41105 [Streptomyces agglomeratus]